MKKVKFVRGGIVVPRKGAKTLKKKNPNPRKLMEVGDHVVEKPKIRKRKK